MMFASNTFSRTTLRHDLNLHVGSRLHVAALPRALPRKVVVPPHLLHLHQTHAAAVAATERPKPAADTVPECDEIRVPAYSSTP